MPEVVAGLDVVPPDSGAPYHRMFASAATVKPRPIVTIVLGTLLFGVAASLAAAGVMALVWVCLGRPGELSAFTAAISTFDSPWGMGAAQLGLATLLPIAWLCSILGNQAHPRWLWSVVGGIRWRVVFWAGLAGVATLVGATLLSRIGQSWAVALQPDFWWFMLAVALTTPLQAAAEEVFFRGYLQQAIGSVASNQWVSVVGSAGIFALYHGVQNVPLFLGRFAFGLLAGWLVIRTGGLEAGVAAHAVNNAAAFVLAGMFDSISHARTLTEIGWGEFALMTGSYALFTGVAVLLASRLGLRTRVASSV
jgi:uncharacterized protein